MQVRPLIDAPHADIRGSRRDSRKLSMALINGTHTCAYCGKDFKWYYTIRENIESTRIFSVERIPNDTSYAEMRYSNETGKQELQARCKYCDRFNILDEDMDI